MGVSEARIGAGRELRAAYTRLDAGDPDAALEILEPLEREGTVASSIYLVAKGVSFDRDERADEAAECFDGAFEHGVPLAALLRECGRHFKRIGQYERAYHCFSLLNYVIPGALKAEFFPDLPPLDVCRYSPIVAPKVLRGKKRSVAVLRSVRRAMRRELGRDGAELVIGQFLGEPTPSKGQLRVAYAKLDAGDHIGAIHALESVPERGTVVAASIELVARGIDFDNRGRREEAERSFEIAFKHGAPLPALLRECGRYFRRAQNYERAYHCLSLLDWLVPGKLKREFLPNLPPTEICRYSPITAPRMLNAPRPQFFLMRPIKETLKQGLGDDGAALVLGSFMRQRAPWGAGRLELASLHDFARERARVFDELVAPREVHLSSPPMYGGETPEGISGSTRSVFFCALPDIVVSSKSNLLLTDDRALMDFQSDEYERVPIDIDVDPIVLGPADGRELTVLRHDKIGREPDLEEALSLVGVHSQNFGHFVVEHLFKVLVSLGRPGFDSVPVLIDEQMPRQLREALEFFVGSEHPILVLGRGGSVKVSSLWTCSAIAYWPAGERSPVAEGLGSLPRPPESELADPDALSTLLQGASDGLRALERPDGRDRLYLTRKSGRRLVNRPEMEQWFEEHGYEVLDFAELPFIEQVRRTRNAEFVIAETGSSVYGLLFARPGVRIGVVGRETEREHEWLNEMFLRLGHRLMLMACEVVEKHPITPDKDNFRADLEQLPGFLDALAEMP